MESKGSLESSIGEKNVGKIFGHGEMFEAELTENQVINDDTVQGMILKVND